MGEALRFRGDVANLREAKKNGSPVIAPVPCSWQVSACGACCLAFIVYLPVGALLTCPARRLSMEDCLADDGASTQ